MMEPILALLKYYEAELDKKVGNWNLQILNASSNKGASVVVWLSLSVYMLAWSRRKREGFTSTIIVFCFFRIVIEHFYPIQQPTETNAGGPV